VPSRAVGFVEPGDDVLLRFHAFPYQKFGQGRGEVVRVSRSALSSGELSSIAVQGSAPEPLYRVIVQLERETVEAFGKQEPLKPGMMLEADVLGEERKLWEWLLEPLYSVRGRTLD
jgi:membrane fusion protein